MIAYLDTSAWIAWKFAQKGQEVFRNVSIEKDTVISHPLLLSEYVSFLSRTDVLSTTRFEDELSFIYWVYPAHPMVESCLECARGFSLRGADLFHLTVAHWFAEDFREELYFLTCDKQQRAVAKKVGFKVV